MVVFFAYGWYGAPGSVYIIILTGVLAGFITTMGVVNIRDLNVPLLFQVTDMFFVLVGIAFIFVIPLMAIITLVENHIRVKAGADIGDHVRATMVAWCHHWKYSNRI